MEWNLNINKVLFDLLEYDNFNADFYTDYSNLQTWTQNQIDIESLCSLVLLKEKVDTDMLLTQISRPLNIITILEKVELTVDQKLKLIKKLKFSSDIFMASQTFTKEELESILKFPNESELEDSDRQITKYISVLVNKSLSSLLLCYLYLYPTKLSKKQEKLMESVLTSIIYSPSCLALITTKRFLSNFSKSFQMKFYTKHLFNINKKLFIYIDKIPDNLYKSCLNKLLSSNHVPIEILLYAKCFNKDYDKFLKFTNIEQFYNALSKRRLVMSYGPYALKFDKKCKDILTAEEYLKCIQYFFKKDSKSFYKYLPNILGIEKDKKRKSILNSYVLMKDLKEIGDMDE